MEGLNAAKRKLDQKFVAIGRQKMDDFFVYCSSMENQGDQIYF